MLRQPPTVLRFVFRPSLGGRAATEPPPVHEADRPDTTAPCAVVLAAGLGRRMGGCAKAALRIGPRTFLECLVDALKGAGLTDIHVVVGPYRDELLPLVLGCGAKPVVHASADPSLVDSQRLALQAHVADHPGRDLLLMPGDLPLLSATNIEPLLKSWRRRNTGVKALVPHVEGQPGHPVFLAWQAINAIDAEPRSFGVRDWMASHTAAVWRLPCDDRAYVTDVDRPEDLERLRLQVHASVVAPAETRATRT